MAKLGQHYEAFASWRRALSRADPGNQVVVYANAVAELAGLTKHGLTKAQVVDELADMAASIGLPTDQAQEIIAQTVDRITTFSAQRTVVVEESGIDWDHLPSAVTLDQLDDAPPVKGHNRPSKWGKGNGQHPQRPNKQPATPLIEVRAFVEQFVRPEYVIESVLQRGFLYSMTGKTGSGKTAVALLMAFCVALGHEFGGLGVHQGRVLYLAGENDIDVQMRCIAMLQQLDVGPEEPLPVFLKTTRFDIAEELPRLLAETRRLGPFDLVIVDTSAAYFQGDEVNSPTQMGDHARMLRSLTTLPGNPCVLVLCHPVKNAANDNLLPLGAGAFLNEVDGNLTVTVDGSAVELHWQGKLRGDDFAPMSFELKSVTHERLVTERGKRMTTVVARHLSDAARDAIERAAVGDAQLLLAEIKAHPRLSVRDYAARLGWMLASGKPSTGKASRALSKLKAARLVTKELEGLVAVELAAKKRPKQGGTERDTE